MNTKTNKRLIRALLRQPVDRTPVWMMRQAGRYLPEYRALRNQASNFMSFCKNPDLASEATLQPLSRFDLDAAIIFSDILTIPDALGMKLQFVPGQGPIFDDPIRTAQDIERLYSESLVQLDYVFQAIKRVVSSLRGQVPVIGFAGSPWTLACYMIEGQGSKTFQTARAFLYQEPALLQQLLEILTQHTIAYLNAQIDAGVEAVMLFDTWGGVLSPAVYQAFSLRYMSNIAENLNRQVNGHRIPVIFFTKNAGQWLEFIADSGCDAVGIDWMTNIADARARIGDRVALQGNLDPALLLTTPEKVTAAVKQLLTDYGSGVGHVFNLGHGIDKSTPIENVTAMVEAVKKYGTNV